MKLNKFLAIAFMCHQKPERSFHFKGKQFPLCARCTGIFAGYFLGVIAAFITNCNNHLFMPLLAVPMAADGLIQFIFRIESNNFRRLITGILGGMGIIYIFINIHLFTVWWVVKFLKFVS